MTIKTPAEIGADVAEKAKKTMMFIDIAALIAEGIEADRAQRALDVNGDTMDPLMAAIAGALDERGSFGDADDARAKKAAAAVRGEGGYEDTIFDCYVAPMLSTLEAVYGA